MKMYLILFILIIGVFNVSAFAKGETLVCLEIPSRIDPCPNLVYRAVKDEAQGKNKMFCYCKTDFDLLFDKNLSKRQLMLNKMELNQILSDTKLTKEQLRQRVSR